jgi:hypothetical protein
VEIPLEELTRIGEKEMNYGYDDPFRAEVLTTCDDSPKAKACFDLLQRGLRRMYPQWEITHSVREKL